MQIFHSLANGSAGKVYVRKPNSKLDMLKQNYRFYIFNFPVMGCIFKESLFVSFNRKHYFYFQKASEITFLQYRNQISLTESQ